VRRKLLYVAVLVPVFMGSLDSTIVSVAFPTMVTHFRTSLVVAGWVLTVYTLVSIAAIPIASRLSDSGRRKQTLITCMILFTAGSACCALAPNMVVNRNIYGRMNPKKVASIFGHYGRQ
jgi:MFS family permease